MYVRRLWSIFYCLQVKDTTIIEMTKVSIFGGVSRV